MISEPIAKINSKPLEPGELKKLDKTEKEGIVLAASSLKDIRVQLNEQLKCLDGRLETQQGIVSEFQDFFRRRADIEAKYSNDLDKLAKLVGNRHKEQKQRRESWNSFSSMQVWEQLIAQTKKSSRDHSALSDIYANKIVQRCNQINEDLARIFKKCREIGYEIHEEVLKVLHELHTAMKTHHAYQSEFRQAENKLQVVERQRVKLQQTVPVEKREKSKKYRLIEKEYQKRKQKFDDARLKATKARNEYLLCMDSANSSIQKYFVDDLSDLIDCMDFGFHQSLSRAVMMHQSGMDQRRRSLQQDIDNLNKSLAAIDSRLDKQRFIEGNNTTFMIPKKFEYAPVRRDESEFVVQKVVLDELESRKQKLEERLTQLKTESEEIWKSMETAEKSLSEIVSCNDYDTTRYFVEEDRASLRESDHLVLKQKSDRKETEDFYMGKFREYVLNSNRIARLQAKYDHIRVTLGDQSSQQVEAGVLTLTRRPNAARRRRIGNNVRNATSGNNGHHKLFGGSLEEYLEETNQDIPMIIRSCVRVINLYGLHHHGIFRVSGSQLEINNFRDSFERGEDPFADTIDASDININSVAGVLKLFLRELREPIFPIQYFDHFMELAQLESKHEFVVKVRDVVTGWPRPVFIVMRYLFAFLNHLSEFSDENMMDPYNLAICFGPTLVPIPEDRDQVQFQSLVNELIKNFIIFHEDIFPSSVPGPTYEKYLTNEPDDMGESPQIHDDLDADSEMTEDDSVFPEGSDRDVSMDLFGKSEVLEAQALYDFKARSAREVNFNKGDTIILYKQVSNDWWRGSVNGTEGLIPDKYITLKIRGEDERERLESQRSIDESIRSHHNSSGSPRQRASSIAGEVLQMTSDTIDSPVAMRRLPVSAATNSPSSQQQQQKSSTSPVSRTSVNSSPPTSFQTSPSTTATRSSSTTVITVAGAVAQSSRESLSLDSGNQSPDTTTGTGNNPQSSLTDSRTDSLLEEVVEAEVPSTGGNTHIIRVSGPVTNLDDTVLSGLVQQNTTDTAEEKKTRSSPEGGARSRMPLTPSMEARLTPSMEAKLSASQDSLLSTGSNQELQNQLDSTIAQVEAFAQEIEKRKLSSVSLNTSSASLNTNHQDGKARSVSIGGARPRIPEVPPRTSPKSSREGGGPVMLRQSSWGSREQVLPSSASSNNYETRSLKKMSSSATAVVPSNPVGSSSNGGEFVKGGFRNNRDFWEQRVNMRQKQTPDLVLDLPTDSPQSNNKTEQQHQPVPKPRTLPSSPSDENPRSLLGGTERNAPASGNSSSSDISPINPNPPRAFGTQLTKGRPQVRVKPQVQARKTPNEKDQKKK